MGGRGVHKFPAGLPIAHKILETQTHAVQRGDLHFHAQNIIVAGRGFVAKMTLDHGKDRVPLLPDQQGLAQEAKELAARGFEHVQVTRIIHMIANRAFRVGDAMVINI